MRRPIHWLLCVLLFAACNQTGDYGPDSSVCDDEVSTALQQLSEAMDTSQMFSASSRVLTAENAEDNLRGCGGTTAEITTARMVTCQYLAMSTPSDYPANLFATLQARCCPSAVAGLQPWCSSFDAGYMF